MTVPAQTPVSTHVGNGVTTSFAYGFKLLDQADIQVTVDGVVKTLTTDYTVTGVGVDAGGTIVFVAAPASLTAIALARRVTVQRLTDYQYSGDFQSPIVNRDFDRIVMMLQDSGVNVANALRFPIGDVVSGVLPDVAGRALKGLAFDALGAPVATAAAGNADALEAALLSTTVSTGGALVGFDPANAYAPNTVGDGIKDASAAAAVAASDLAAFKANLLLSTGVAGTGALLSGYKLPSGVSVGRTLQDKLDDFVSAKDFGLATTNTGAQNVTALQNAIAFSIAVGGCTIHIPRGTYDFNGNISLTGADGIRITGDGPEATKLRITHATADFFSSTGNTYYQTIDNLTLTSTVTRTAGAMFKAAFWARSIMHRVKITEHHTGIDLPGFEQSTLSEVFIVKPSGAATSIVCGTAAATNQGANLNILNCFGRGNNDLTNDVPIGLNALVIFDVEAVFCVNSDFANYLNQIVVVAPNTRTANCHFVQTYFDGTVNADNFLMTGAGIKQQFQFTGCWFNGAGRHGAGAIDAYGVNAIGTGEYYDFNFTGCRWLSHSGAQFVSTSLYMDFTFTGCVFTNPGLNAGSVQRHSILLNPTGVVVKWPIISGCKFQGTPAAAANVVCTGNASTGMVVNGCNLDRGMVKAATAYYGSVQGNWDQTAIAAIASASSITIPATVDYLVISGTTTINEIRPTWAGHKVAFRTTSALTWGDDTGNLRLVGNYVTTGNSVLTLVCEANGDWREVARATS